MHRDIHQDHIDQINAFIIVEADPLEKTKLMFWLSMVNEQAHIADQFLSANALHNRRFDDNEIKLRDVKKEVDKHTRLANRTDTALYIFSAIGGIMLGVSAWLFTEARDTINTLAENQIEIRTNQRTVMANQVEDSKSLHEILKELNKK